MAKDRRIVCIYYEYEGCQCAKRSCECYFKKEMQTCGKYEPRPGAREQLNKKKEFKNRKENYYD